MGVGAYIRDCLLTKPSRILAPSVRLLFILLTTQKMMLHYRPQKYVDVLLTKKG